MDDERNTDSADDNASDDELALDDGTDEDEEMYQVCCLRHVASGRVGRSRT